MDTRTVAPNLQRRCPATPLAGDLTFLKYPLAATARICATGRPRVRGRLAIYSGRIESTECATPLPMIRCALDRAHPQAMVGGIARRTARDLDLVAGLEGIARNVVAG